MAMRANLDIPWGNLLWCLTPTPPQTGHTQARHLLEPYPAQVPVPRFTLGLEQTTLNPAGARLGQTPSPPKPAFPDPTRREQCRVPMVTYNHAMMRVPTGDGACGDDDDRVV